jgi:hypothetical protein
MPLRTVRLAACLSLLAAPAFACLHMPADFAGSVEQSAQGGIVIWNDGHEELILKNDFVIRADDGATLPSSLAWVVPVPNEPSRYGVESPNVFESMFNLWEAEASRWRDRTGEVVLEEASKGWGARNAPVDSLDADEPNEGIELLEAHQVGAYEIQPIRTTGPQSGPALNAWLTENGFSAVPAANMAYYVERNWVWLAVKVNAPQDARSLSERGTMQPLRISFASDEVVYPLKFSSHQGTFDVALWVITAEPLQGFERRGQKTSTHPLRTADNPLIDYAFHGEGRWLPLPETVSSAQRAAAQDGDYEPLQDAVGTKVPHVTRLFATVNGAETTSWKQDFALKTR